MCSGCVSQPGCGYCLSTFQCSQGDSSGSFGEAKCDDWLFGENSCPGKSCTFPTDRTYFPESLLNAVHCWWKISTPLLASADIVAAVCFCLFVFSFVLWLLGLAIPVCGEYIDCLSCAADKECAWCASANQCLTIGDAMSADCRGLVFDPPCPTNYIAGEQRRSFSFRCCAPFLDVL